MSTFARQLLNEGQVDKLLRWSGQFLRKYIFSTTDEDMPDLDWSSTHAIGEFVRDVVQSMNVRESGSGSRWLHLSRAIVTGRSNAASEDDLIEDFSRARLVPAGAFIRYIHENLSVHGHSFLGQDKVICRGQNESQDASTEMQPRPTNDSSCQTETYEKDIRGQSTRQPIVEGFHTIDGPGTSQVVEAHVSTAEDINVAINEDGEQFADRSEGDIQVGRSDVERLAAILCAKLPADDPDVVSCLHAIDSRKLKRLRQRRRARSEKITGDRPARIHQAPEYNRDRRGRW